MKNTLFILTLLLITSGFSQKAKVDLSNPNATIYTHLYFLQSDSYQPNKAAKTIYGYKGKEAVDKAIKIKEILDGKGLKVDLSRISKNPQYSDSISYRMGNTYVLFPERMPQISLEKYGDKWLFSEETLLQIDALHKKVFPWYSLQKSLPKYTHNKLFGIQLWQYLGALVIMVFVFLFMKIIGKLTFFILKKLQYLITKKTSDRIVLPLKKLNRPLLLLIVSAIIKKVLPTLLLGIEINNFLFLTINIAQIAFWIYVFLNLVDVIMTVYTDHTKRTHLKLDDQLGPILSRFLTGIVFFLGFLKLLTLFGISAANVLAGASIGGIALALASQDTVKNFLGTFMIFLDKPFHIGDWIETSELQGTVEEVGFRSTRIRAADTSIFQIPNSTLSEIVINNKGLRLFRRYKTELGIRYDTPPELIEAFVESIRELIVAHPKAKEDEYDVTFSGFGDSALIIMVNVYFNVDTWSVEQQAKHDFHIAIVKTATILGVEFAFPSTTLMIEQFPEKKNLSMNYKSTISKAEIKAVVTGIRNV